MKNLIILMILISVGSIADEQQLTNKQKAENYLKELKESEISAEDLEKIEELWEESANDDYIDSFIVESLMMQHRKLRSALRNYHKEYYNKSIEKLDTIQTKNNYYKAAIEYYKSMSYVNLGEYHKATECLQAIIDDLKDYSQNEAELLLYLGICQSNTLNRKEAIKTIEKFLEEYPNASERHIISAEQLLDDLNIRNENELLDLSDRMEIVRRRLDKVQTDKETQEKQQEIVDILDDLIKKLDKENGDGNGDDQDNEDQGGESPSNPSSPGSGRLPEGNPLEGDLPDRRSSGGGWGKIREKERGIIDRLEEGNFPERYKKLLEQYFQDDPND